MRFLCNHNQRLPNAIFDFRKIPNILKNAFLRKIFPYFPSYFPGNNPGFGVITNLYPKRTRLTPSVPFITFGLRMKKPN